MAKINEGSFHDWNDGETVKARDYKQEREIIRVAVNDTHDRFLDEQANFQQIKTVVEENVPKIEAFETTAAEVETKGNYALAQGDYAKGQGNAIQQALEKSVNLLKSPTKPDGIVEGRLWLDTSDNAYQGTVFNELSTQFAQTETKVNNIHVDVKKDFGANGDGVTNDSPAFQNAIDYLASVGGGTLFVPHGRYLINTNIQLINDIVIKGTKLSTFLVPDNISCFEAVGKARMTFETLRFEGRSGNRTSNNKGLFFRSNSSRITIHDVYMQDLQISIHLDYAWITQISSLRIQRCGTGVHARPQANALTIRDSVINNADADAVLFGNGEGLVLENVGIHHSKRAISLLTRSWSVSVIGCYLERNRDYQLYIAGSDEHGEATWCKGITIIGNNFERIIGSDDNTENQRKINSEIFVRLTNGITIQGNNFRNRDSAYQNHHILFYDIDGGKVRNVSVGSNGFFLPGETAIIWTTSWEGSVNFPTSYRQQPFGFLGEPDEFKTNKITSKSGATLDVNGLIIQSNGTISRHVGSVGSINVGASVTYSEWFIPHGESYEITIRANRGDDSNLSKYLVARRNSVITVNPIATSSIISFSMEGINPRITNNDSGSRSITISVQRIF